MPSIAIDIVSDVVCPWCYVGKHRLARAVELLRAETGEIELRTRWLPFFLNPLTPPEGEPYLPFLERKFGGRAKVEALWERLRVSGRSVGIEFFFEKISTRANTLQTHRLLHWAQQRGDADALVESLFRANFRDGVNVGDTAELVRIAAACGYPGDEVAAYLATDEDRELVRAQERHSRGIGVVSVPTYIFGGRHVLSGAERPELIADAIRQHLADVGST